MFLRTLSLTRKEILHIIRDPRTLVIMIVLPLVMQFVLGYAATTDIEHLRTAVYDADKTPQSRELIEAYRNSSYFDIVTYVDQEDDLAYLIDHGDARSALIIPAGYGQHIASQERANVAFVIDGSDPTVATTVLAASQRVGQAVTINTIEKYFGMSGSRFQAVEVRPRVWYNPNLKSAHFMIPGLMVIVLFLFTTLFTSTSIVRERELGTIEQLIVTPIKPIELVVAKVVPYVLVSSFVFIEVLIVGVLVFGVPVKGSLSLLLSLAGLFIITALGIGIFISSAAKTQLEAFLMTLGTILPSFFLSGFFFPIEAMPGWLQLITYIVPVRYGLVIIRGILLKGVGLEILLDQVVAVIIFSLVIVILASVRFKKKL
jgi:ABC-2 type transport system permease protein